MLGQSPILRTCDLNVALFTDDCIDSVSVNHCNLQKGLPLPVGVVSTPDQFEQVVSAIGVGWTPVKACNQQGANPCRS